MLEELETRYAADKTPERHLELIDQARQTTFSHTDTIDTYFHKDLQLRRQMADADVPNIELEVATVNYLISDYAPTPISASTFQTFNGANIDIIQKVRNTITSYFQLAPPQEQTLHSDYTKETINSLKYYEYHQT